MKNFVIALAIAATPSLVFAADMPLAKPAVATMPVKALAFDTGSGWYCGVGTQAGVAQANVSGNNLFATSLVSGSLTADGAGVGGGCGWITNKGPLGSWMQIEVDGFYENITATMGPVSVASRWSATEEIDIGISAFSALQQAFTALGGANGLNLPFPSFTPSLPAGVAVAAAPRQYIGFKAEQFGLTGNAFSAGGATIGWAPGLTTGWRWQTLNAAGQPNGGSLKIYADVFWPQRGNTFDTDGGAITGASKFTTAYKLGVKYDFCVSCL